MTPLIALIIWIILMIVVLLANHAAGEVSENNVEGRRHPW